MYFGRPIAPVSTQLFFSCDWAFKDCSIMICSALCWNLACSATAFRSKFWFWSSLDLCCMLTIWRSQWRSDARSEVDWRSVVLAREPDLTNLSLGWIKAWDPVSLACLCFDRYHTWRFEDCVDWRHRLQLHLNDITVLFLRIYSSKVKFSCQGWFNEWKQVVWVWQFAHSPSAFSVLFPQTKPFFLRGAPISDLSPLQWLGCFDNGMPFVHMRIHLSILHPITKRLIWQVARSPSTSRSINLWSFPP